MRSFRSAGHICALALVLSCAVTAPAYAYLSPQQVFGTGPGPSASSAPSGGTTASSSGSYGAAPQAGNEPGDPTPVNVTQRNAAERAAEQQRVSAVRRKQEQSVLVKQQPASSTAALGIATPASSDPSLFTDEGQYERRQERMDGQNDGTPTIIINNGVATVTDGRGRVYHSGAPGITGTGPESIVAFLAALAAASLTVAVAWIGPRRILSMVIR